MLTTLELETQVLEEHLDVAGRIRSADRDETTARELVSFEVRTTLVRAAHLLGFDVTEDRVEATLQGWILAYRNGPQRPEPVVSKAVSRVEAACDALRNVGALGGVTMIADDPVRVVSAPLQQAVIDALTAQARLGLQVIYVTERPAAIEAMLHHDGVTASV